MMAQHLNFDESIALAKASGCAGIDFRTGSPPPYTFDHGVELERTAEERKQMRRKLEDNYLEIASLNTDYRFESLDLTERQRNIDKAKLECELAHDLGCSRIRVFGNAIRTEDARDCVAYVAKSLAEVADHAAPLGVTVMLEMHGQFNYWGYALEAMRLADRPNVGILYNCDARDLLNGSCIETFKRVEKYVRHIHMHDLSGPYPYVELFEELIRIGYDGYLSAEIKETPDPTRVMVLHNIGVRALIEIARRNVKMHG
jgi:sugar phosphate isomerase/epimerase